MTTHAGTRTLGVVGHVDHGKTALVRALTNIETDRLAEERARGLSIVLGFAHFELEDGVVDLIDVPGHEAFIRAMVAGATGLDGVLLVVAANKGVQPQTVEHFAIARLLDLRRGVVVLTKSDLVDAPTLERARRDVEALIDGTFLASAPIVAVSAMTGQGAGELKAAIGALPAHRQVAHDSQPFCLPLDRVFSMRGFGVVGTGTVRSGRIAVGDDVEILPRGSGTSIRALQRHGKAVESACAGERVAVNLRGIGRDAVARGDTVATAGALSASQRIDVALELLSESHTSIKNGQSLRMLIGTTDVVVKVRLLEAAELAPGKTGLAQLRCERALVCQRSERFILRTDSPSRTLGGGRIIEPHAPRRRRFDVAVIAALGRAGSASANARVAQILDAAGAAGVTAEALAAQADVGREELQSLVQALGAVTIGSERLVEAEAAARVREQIVAALKAYHATHPMRRGMSVSELASSLPEGAGLDVLKWALAVLRDAHEIAGSFDRVHLAGFDPLARLSDAERAAADTIAAQFRRGGIEPPSLAEIATRSRALQAIVNLLLETGELVRLQTTDRKLAMALHADVLQEAKKRLASRYPYPAKFAVKDARDLLGSTRRFVVPVLEHLDATGFTLRLGDMRQLRAEHEGGE